MFHKSTGFISHVHLIKSPQKTFWTGKPLCNRKNFLCISWLIRFFFSSHYRRYQRAFSGTLFPPQEPGSRFSSEIVFFRKYKPLVAFCFACKIMYCLPITLTPQNFSKSLAKSIEQNSHLHVEIADRNLSLVVKLSFGFTLQPLKTSWD